MYKKHIISKIQYKLIKLINCFKSRNFEVSTKLVMVDNLYVHKLSDFYMNND